MKSLRKIVPGILVATTGGVILIAIFIKMPSSQVAPSNKIAPSTQIAPLPKQNFQDRAETEIIPPPKQSYYDKVETEIASPLKPDFNDSARMEIMPPPKPDFNGQVKTEITPGDPSLARGRAAHEHNLAGIFNKIKSRDEAEYNVDSTMKN